jgi:alpha-galactosidase
MMRHTLLLSGLLALTVTRLLAAGTLPLTKAVNVRHAETEFARPAADLSTAGSRQPLRIAGRTYPTGLGTQLETNVHLAVNGATRFTAQAGVDDATKDGVAVIFEVQADGQTLWRSGELRRGQPPVAVDVDLRGRQELRLLTLEAGRAYSQAHADWVDAQFEFEGVPPASKPAPPPVEAPYILTPKPGPAPRINSPRVFGVRPGHPVVFTIAATGDRPMRFAADGLPAGLSLDPATGRITGDVVRPGTHTVTLGATNDRGTASQKLRLEVGERIALTPPLGWNSWNCWGAAVDADKVRRAARAMAASGLVNHGWSYINIDDAWQAPRGGPHHALLGNEKFPDLKGLADEIHALGLRVGIYSTPWVTSYANYPGGSVRTVGEKWVRPRTPRDDRVIGPVSHAVDDAKQWAEWGVDYLKYDWNPNQRAETAEMASALRLSGRDIVYSLSNSMPFSNVAELSHLAHAWRTTGDITDTWGSMQRIGFAQERWRPFGGPGHWNDPDMLVVGWVGWGPNLHPTRLTPSEQYTHITLWSLLCSPLLLGCDLERLDDFTLNLLTNDEVIEVSQDPRGEQAAQLAGGDRRQVWAKAMEDGSRAIGLFNLSRTPDEVTVTWAQLGLTGPPARVRDLWRQQDLPVGVDGHTVGLPRHGAALLRAWPATP